MCLPASEAYSTHKPLRSSSSPRRPRGAPAARRSSPKFFKVPAGTLKNLGEERLAAGAPLGRLGDDEDLKGLCVLYASDAGKHITGQWLAVDGGVSVVMGG